VENRERVPFPVIRYIEIRRLHVDMAADRASLAERLSGISQPPSRAVSVPTRQRRQAHS
jgi:hypothetical protein